MRNMNFKSIGSKKLLEQNGNRDRPMRPIHTTLQGNQQSCGFGRVHRATPGFMPPAARIPEDGSPTSANPFPDSDEAGA